MSVVPATPENVAAAIADPNAPLPVGARRMSEAERQLHVSNVLNALFKQSTVRQQLGSLFHPNPIPSCTTLLE